RQPDLLEVMQTPLTIIHGMVALLERYQQEGVLIEEPPTQAFLALVGPIFMGGILRSVLMDVFAGPVAPAAHVERYLAGRRVGTRK
ncbi:MAG: hypothetical protein KDE47_33975, partial [Caldilineaceae bacterium]|nr:hypothetical protein [Caldilineaceae bacterium]